MLDVEKCKSVLFVMIFFKRSLSPGYAGIDNDLFFYKENTKEKIGKAKN